MKRHSASAKLVLALATTLLAACSTSDDRSLVLLDVQLAADAPTPETIRLTVSAGTVVKTADVPWAKAVNGVLQVGLFVPEGVAGPVTVVAQGLVGGAVVAEGTHGPVALKTGGSVGPFPLVLYVPVAPPPGGDAGAEVGADAGVTEDAPPGEAGGIDATGPSPGRDATPSEARPSDLLPVDGGQPDAPADVPLSPDGPVDYPATEIDGGADATPPPVDSGLESEAGQAPTWHPAENVENDLLSRSFYPSLAVDPVSEHVYVAWEESTAIKVKRWNRGTATWEKTFTIDNRGSPAGATLGADGKGNVILAWLQEAMGGDTTLHGVWVSQTADGLSWTSPVHVASGKIYGDPQLAVARNGTARLVYGRQTETNIMPLFTAYYDGVAWTENPDIIDPVDHSSGQDPRLAIDASGNAILVFDKEDGDGKDSVAAVTMTGQTFSDPVILDANTVHYVYLDQRSVAMNRKGEGVVVWSEYTNTTSYDMVMYARSYNPSVGWSSQSPAIVSSGDIYGVRAVMDEQGVVTIAWQQTIASGMMNTMAIRGTLTGTWSDVAVLETDNTTGYLLTELARPQLAVDASGNVLIVWRKEIDTAELVTYGAYASRYADGAWLPQFRLGQKTGYNVLTLSLSVADSGLGAAAFVYTSNTGDASDPDSYNTHVAFFR
ncbi:MAG: hypothetical protein JXP73_09240 [Deltaproteobacteria bacterium]|nr:hypothetical protein [Deltaproteobacteria bacterium]